MMVDSLAVFNYIKYQLAEAEKDLELSERASLEEYAKAQGKVEALREVLINFYQTTEKDQTSWSEKEWVIVEIPHDYPLGPRPLHRDAVAVSFVEHWSRAYASQAAQKALKLPVDQKFLVFALGAGQTYQREVCPRCKGTDGGHMRWCTGVQGTQEV